MKLLLVLLLLFPSVAMASDKCCFKGPGDCSVISSASEMETCKTTPSTVALSSTCKESPECMLSEEPTPQSAAFNGGLLQRDATFTDISGKAKSVR
ncbi:MAG: hypothetical protein ABSH41_31510 [Syntrophobacteraceae bacterium]